MSLLQRGLSPPETLIDISAERTVRTGSFFSQPLSTRSGFRRSAHDADRLRKRDSLSGRIRHHILPYDGVHYHDLRLRIADRHSAEPEQPNCSSESIFAQTNHKSKYLTVELLSCVSFHAKLFDPVV